MAHLTPGRPHTAVRHSVWRNSAGSKSDDAKRLEDLERENATLKQLSTDAQLEQVALNEIGRGTSRPGALARCRAPIRAGDAGQ
jgi:putative transposase